MRVETRASNTGICVVYADDAIVVLDKPADLLSVPGRGPDKQDCLCNRVKEQYRDALVVHRLDMATSGLMLMARGACAQRALSQAFANRMVTKRYEAVVHGKVSMLQGAWRVIDLPIGTDWDNRPRRIIDWLCGKPSVTRLQVDHYDVQRNVTFVALEPLTGRTHQLRLHLKAIGHPILGDKLYAPPTVVNMASRLLLHASNLSFAHPVSGQMMRFDRQRLKCDSDTHTEC